MLVVVLVLENPDRFAIRLCAVRFGYLSEGEFFDRSGLGPGGGPTDQRTDPVALRSSHQPPATSL